MLRRLWNDKAGALISAEYLLIGTLLAIGLLVGVGAVRAALIRQIHDLAGIVLN